MSARFAGKIIFMPYVWVDGLYSLVAAPGGKEKRGDSGFHGGNCVIEHLQEAGLTDTLNDFQNGALNFRHQSRFDASMAELERREDFADVKVAPFIRERFRDEPMMLTHNHPHPKLINEFARQIAEKLDLNFQEILPSDYLNYAEITLPEFGRLLTPYGAEELGLRYAYDLQWLGSRLIDNQSQNKTVAARAMADRKTFGHLS